MTKWTIPSPAIERLTAKIKQQDRQIETQAATIAAQNVKVLRLERAADELRRRLEIAKAKQ